MVRAIEHWSPNVPRPFRRTTCTYEVQTKDRPRTDVSLSSPPPRVCLLCFVRSLSVWCVETTTTRTSNRVEYYAGTTTRVATLITTLTIYLRQETNEESIVRVCVKNYYGTYGLAPSLFFFKSKILQSLHNIILSTVLCLYDLEEEEEKNPQ